MYQALESYTPEIKDRLAKSGLKPYQPKPVENWANPHSGVYKTTNIMIFSYCAYMRYVATKQNSTRMLWTIAALSTLYLWPASKVKLDTEYQFTGKRTTLEDYLLFKPVARRAWNRALKENEEYQAKLKREIEEIEQKIVLK